MYDTTVPNAPLVYRTHQIIECIRIGNADGDDASGHVVGKVDAF